MNVAKVKRLKSLKVENVKLEKLLSEQVLVNEALKELVKKRCWSGNTVSGPMPKVYRFGLCRDCNCPKSGQNKTARQLIPWRWHRNIKTMSGVLISSVFYVQRSEVEDLCRRRWTYQRMLGPGSDKLHPCHHLIKTLNQLMTIHGRPRYIHSDNGPEFTAKVFMQWLTENRIGPVFIKPGFPWQNAYYRKLQWKIMGWVPFKRMFFKLDGCQSHYRKVASLLQSWTAT